MSENRQIVKNTVMLYIRMAVNTLISLYTLRVVLRVLGAEDYGIYSVVSSLLTVFSVLNASMASATSRFLTFELGRGNRSGLQSVFWAALFIHLGLAACIVLLGESAGGWFLRNKLVIPPERMDAAIWVFHFSMAATFFSIMQVPFHALVMAHENMGVYAGIEIFRSCFNLLLVGVLWLGKLDKLILYAVLMCVITVVVTAVYIFYCFFRFPECRSAKETDRSVIRGMLSFSLWDLYGNICMMLRNQGVNILLNMNFGPVMNAAAEISGKVQGVTSTFANNISLAVRPQIVKSYSRNDFLRMVSLMRNGSRMTFVLMLLCTVPLICEIHFVLAFWLGEVPPGTDVLCIFQLLWNLISALNVSQSIAIQATGHVRRNSFIVGTLFMISMPVAWVAFRIGLPYWVPYFYNVLVLAGCLYAAKKTLEGNIPGYKMNQTLLPDNIRGYTALLLSLLSTVSIQRFLPESLLRFFLSLCISSTAVCLGGYFIVFPKKERKAILNKFLSVFFKEKIL